MEEKDKKQEEISKKFSKSLLWLAIGVVFCSLPEFIVSYECILSPCYMKDPPLIANMKIMFRVISLLFFFKGFLYMKQYHQEMKKFIESDKANAGN
jgi:hypothetical protein